MNRRRSTAVSIEHATRTAVYTRKSTDEGLDRGFNSLDNQRERAEAYAASQGWSVMADRYDDGGFSGGTTDRPALQRLRTDIAAGRIDAVVVYRLDRLSRSLRDFLELSEYLDGHDVALVSVTESINTSTPHGRMMVNVLLSFAQYERELGAERTRHKIASARRRGKWTGGTPRLGYDVVPEGGRIVPNRDEAKQVVAIFELYAATPSLLQIVQELNRRGWTTKSWTTREGKQRSGKPWSKSSLRNLLSDPIYIGMQTLGDETFKGEHDGIVPKKLWQQVQALMAKNHRDGGAAFRNGHGFLLRGLLRCSACDAAMTPHATKRRNRSYRYYTCRSAQKNGHATCPAKSVNADRIEQFLIDQLRQIGTDSALQAATFDAAVAQVKAERRGLRAEQKRLERDRDGLATDMERLVATLSRTEGPAADAVAGQLNVAQARAATIEARLREITDALAALKTQEIDRDDVARALVDFDEIWGVLLVPERERILRLVVERISYDSRDGKMTID